ncbi:LysR substrate-binding domain-containing protein [Novosphingobium cyanobacteriorum]|uniref:LysR substrate-binding domain-containing protein n=1 Tax=Novosphingobium cyanobacteriorum TaxID=3024215 RepID=A0ABT6CF57_9SPHN|nr:LysR substrate-binding domain-containing protein [Novosphingobium cyanobacteriorum]MDF8332179.1 LysR substrate-binding domain-containing protein [Novosphingobium cyanobacteriorum]
MKLHHLRDFITIARAGGIRAAARELGLTQPALTKSLRSLEQELGSTLFDRSRRGVAINSFGEAFLVRAEAALHQIERGRNEVLQLKGSAGGNVSIATSSVVALMFLSAALADFRKSYPDASVSVQEGTFSNMLRGLRDGVLDFAIGPKPAADLAEDFATEKLFDNSRRVIGRRGHPLANATSLGELLDAPWVLTGAVGPRYHEFYEIFRDYGFKPPPALIQCESLIALMALLDGSDAITFLPRQWAEAAITRGLLVEFPVKETIEGPATCLMYQVGAPLTPVAEALADSFRRQVGHYLAGRRT